MQKIDFNKTMTFTRAVLMPFHIAPVLTSLIWLHDIIGLAVAPLNVFATSHFINTMIKVFSKEAQMGDTLPSFLFMTAIQLYGYILDPVMQMMEQKRQQKNWVALSHELLPTYAGLELRHIEDSDTMDLIIRVWSESPEILIPTISEDVKDFAVQAGIVISYVAILLTNAPLTGLIIILASIPTILIARKCGKEQYETKQDLTPIDRKTEELGLYLRGRNWAAERTLFSYSGTLNKRRAVLRGEAQKSRLHMDTKNNKRKLLSSSILTLLSAVSWLLLLPSMVNGRISVGMLISLIGVLFTTVNQVAFGFSTYFEYFAIDSKYIKDFNAYMALSKEEGALDPIAAEPRSFERLEFKNVSFSYPGTDKKVLDNLSFTIEAGKHYSLVGINGSGKTTITKLMLRMYNNYDGEILLNGRPLRQYPMAEVKAMFTAVFQDFERYDISLADNINAGRGLRAEEAEIDAAIDAVGLSDMVGHMKNGKDTLLGKIYDDGEELSGGQWQRIAIARAVISQAQVKILDEPTASLDPIAEKEVYENFDKISRNAATLFISHRLASAKMADIIYVLDGGRIAECGDHHALMEKGGLYAAMFTAQQEWYS